MLPYTAGDAVSDEETSETPDSDVLATWTSPIEVLVDIETEVADAESSVSTDEVVVEDIDSVCVDGRELPVELIASAGQDDELVHWDAEVVVDQLCQSDVAVGVSDHVHEELDPVWSVHGSMLYVGGGGPFHGACTCPSSISEAV